MAEVLKIEPSRRRPENTRDPDAWRPTAEQRAAARDRVGATWARMLAERHPGHQFIIEWDDDAEDSSR